MSDARIHMTCDTVGFEWAMIYAEVACLRWKSRRRSDVCNPESPNRSAENPGFVDRRSALRFQGLREVSRNWMGAKR